METIVSSLTLRELARLYHAHAIKHYRRRSGEPTREHLNMRAAVDRFVNFAGETNSPARVNRHQVRAWLDQLSAEQLTRTYINSLLSRLRRFIAWSADLDYIPVSIVQELRLVRPLTPFRSSAREPVLTPPPALSDLDRLAAVLPPRARDVLQLLKLTGARPSEILELRNADVHLDDRGPRLTPAQHKSAHLGKSRVIPLCAAAIAIVDRHWRPLLPADFVFPSRSRSGHLTIDGLRTCVSRACATHKLPHLKLYDVRRAVARQVRSRAGLDAAQALLGHSNASTTEIYAPLDEGDQLAFSFAMLGVASIEEGGAR